MRSVSTTSAQVTGCDGGEFLQRLRFCGGVGDTRHNRHCLKQVDLMQGGRWPCQAEPRTRYYSHDEPCRPVTIPCVGEGKMNRFPWTQVNNTWRHQQSGEFRAGSAEGAGALGWTGGTSGPLAVPLLLPRKQEEVRELGTGGKERKQALRSVPSDSHLQSSSNRGWSGVGGAAHLPSCLPGPSCPHRLQGPGGGAPRSHPTPTTDLNSFSVSGPGTDLGDSPCQF